MKKNIPTLFLILFTAVISYGQCFTSITAGGFHSIGQKPNGTIWTWGYGAWGELGLGDSSDAFLPTQVGTATNWHLLTAGNVDTFGIKTNGTLWATGGGNYGELGDGGSGLGHEIFNFIQIGTATNWKVISANNYHTIGLRANGTLWSWGQNNEGQLGDGTATDKNIPTQLGIETDWKLITTGGAFCISIKTNGTMWSWGSNSSGSLGIGDLSVQSVSSPVQIGTQNDWKTVTSGPGSYIVMAIKNNGTLYCFGGLWNSGEGGLGLGLGVHLSSSPSQVGSDNNWQSVSVGFNNAFGIKTDGTLWAWGQNDLGQLGDGTTVDKGFPTQIGTDTDWATVSAGNMHTIGRKTNGALYSWGDNSSGQLGTGSTTGSLLPTQVNVTGCTLATDDFTADENKFILSPNPAKNEVNLFIKNNIAFDNIEVYDISGRLVLKTFVTAQGDGFSFNVSSLSRGIYNVVVKDGDKKVLVEKMVKE